MTGSISKPNTTVPVKKVTLEAVVHRADGSTEDLGTIAHWDRSWFRRWAWKLGRRK